MVIFVEDAYVIISETSSVSFETTVEKNFFFVSVSVCVCMYVPR